jgi:transcriptional regulator with XRE-family HTH domain
MAATDDANPSAASQIREMRARLGWSQQLAARHAGVSVSTIKRLERRGVGHNQRRVSTALQSALEEPAAGPTPRDVVDSFVASSGEPPSIMVREFLAFLETLSVEQQWAAVRTFALTVTSLARARGEIAGPVEGKDD